MTRANASFRPAWRTVARVLAASLALAPLAAPAAHAAPAPAVIDDQAALRLAHAFRSAGDPASAAQLLRQLSARKGAAPELRIELGDALMDAGLLDEAASVHEAAAADKRIAARAQLGLARTQLALDQPAKALEHADRAAALAASDVRTLVLRGVILDRLGRHGEAQGAYRTALAAEPRSLAARSDLALSLALSGGYDEAVQILTPIARSADATPRDRQNLAFVLGLKGDRDGALALGRMDLDEAAAQANARFFDAADQPVK